MTEVDYRYARALLIAAGDKNKLDIFRNQMSMLAESLKGTPELGAVLISPGITRQAKKRIVNRVFSEKLDRELLSFIMLVIDKKRENRLADISRAFIALAERERNIVRVLVVTAEALDGNEKKLLRDRLSQTFGVTAKLENRIDKSILGGIVIKLDDLLLDGSLRGRLEAVRDSIYNAAACRIGVKGKGGY